LKAGQPLPWRTALAKISQYVKKKRRPIYQNNFPGTFLIKTNGKTLDTTGDFYTTWGLPGPRNRDEPVKNAPSKPGEVFGATGGGAIYRAAIFDDIDMFDEDFFMYYEDVDLSFRAQLAGWKVRFTPKAIAYHKIGASSKKVPGLAVYNTFKNLPLVFIKNVPGKLFWCFV
jgi:GT2 family glycosyltransferase